MVGVQTRPADFTFKGRKQAKRCKCCRVHRKTMNDMSKLLIQALGALDAEMKKPTGPERGKRIAAIANAIDIQRQVMERFTLNGFQCKPAEQE